MPSDIYSSFGAKVQYAEGLPGLFMVVAGGGDPSRLIEAYGGVVVLRLNGGNKMIARLTLPKALALQKESSIRMVGGVNLDLNRYRALLESLGVPQGPIGG
jgi:hypothetical protein